MSIRDWLRAKPYEPYRWQELADYNSRLHKGIVHQPWYDARMREEQAAFNAEHADSGGLFPVTLEPQR